MSTMGNTGAGATTGTTTGSTTTSMPSAMNPAHPTPVRHARLGETKSAWKTTELLAYLATVAAIVITAYYAGDNGDGSGSGDGDYFRADKALTLVVITTVGYLLSRGLAKAGSRSRHDD